MKLIIFIIILVLLIIIVNSININIYEFKNIDETTIELSKKLYNGNEWNHYRLGDIYFFQNISKGISSIDYHIKDYPGSIAEEYLKKNKPINFQHKRLISNINNKDLKLYKFIDTYFKAYCKFNKIKKKKPKYFK